MTAPELFCPFCAAPMQRVGRELTCVIGEMSLSRRLETILLERFGGRARGDAPQPARGAALYCPACRAPLGEDLTCAACAGTIRDLRFQLIEFHPHRQPE